MVRKPGDHPVAQNFDNGAFNGSVSLFVDDPEDRFTRRGLHFVETPASQFFGNLVHQHDSTFKIGDDYRVTDAQESHSEEIFLPFDLGQSIGTVLNFTSDSAIGPIDKSEVDDGNSAEQYVPLQGGPLQSAFGFFDDSPFTS